MNNNNLNKGRRECRTGNYRVIVVDLTDEKLLCKATVHATGKPDSVRRIFRAVSKKYGDKLATHNIAFFVRSFVSDMNGTEEFFREESTFTWFPSEKMLYLRKGDNYVNKKWSLEYLRSYEFVDGCFMKDKAYPLDHIPVDIEKCGE